MRADSVVAGQIIGSCSLSLRGGPGMQGELKLQLQPAEHGDDVTLRFRSEAAHLLDRELPARIHATIPREPSNQLLRALRQMCVADRLKARRRQGLEVSWQLQLSGGLWEVGFCETEDHPPLTRALDAVASLAQMASQLPGAEVLQAPPPPPKSERGWLALVALLAAVALTAFAVVVLSGCSDAGEGEGSGAGANGPGEHSWPEDLNGRTTRFPLTPEVHDGERPRRWVDNIVLATRYIEPVKTSP